MEVDLRYSLLNRCEYAASRLWLMMAILSFTSVWAGGPTGVQPPVAGVVIVKFIADHPIDSKARAVLAGESFDSAAFSRLLEPVSLAVGLPLEATRVTSGGEVLLQLPRTSVLDRLAMHLQGQKDVAKVVEELDLSGNPFFSRDRARVSFQTGSPFGNAVSQALGDPSSMPEVANKLADTLLEQTSYPTSATLLPDGRLELTLDWERLTDTLASALRRLDDVDYVQVERLMRR